MSDQRRTPGRLDLSWLQQLRQRPAPFTPGDPLFWDDPHISRQMLAIHLDPHHRGGQPRFCHHRPLGGLAQRQPQPEAGR